MLRVCLTLAACAAPLTAAASAPAAVRIEDDRVVVTSGRASAVVERAPFRLSVRDAAGRTVLRQVAAPRRARPLPPTTDPEPFAIEEQPDRATYAPLTFEVGTEDRDQWNGSYWAGNMLRSRRSGTVHTVRSVTRAERRGRGVRLTVATTDRTRRLLVTVTPDRAGGFRVRAVPTRTAGVITMGDAFATAPGEGFHGFGGRHGTVNKRGEKLYGWTEQENFGGEPTLRATQLLPALTEQGTDFTLDQLGGLLDVPGRIPGGFERYLVPGGPNAAYYPQNLFVSSRGYGFLLNHFEFSRWRMANDRPDAWQVQASAPRLDYTVTTGPSPARAMARLTAITGRHLLPPAWAQGAVLWRLVQINGFVETAETYRAKIEQDLADLERYDVQLAGYAFEGWRLLGDDETRDIIRRLKARGTRAILYHRAYLANDQLRTERPEDVEEALREGWVAKDAQGRPYAYDANGAPGYVWDFTNPAARRGWARRVEHSLELGADGFMQDFGEQVQEDMRFADGSTGVTMHNRLPVLYHRLTRQVVDRWAARNGRADDPVWFFTRAGFSGRKGSAADEMGNFPGDETVDWSAGSGLRSLAPDMLNRAVGGAFGFTTDIGGYADLLTGPPNAELFTRWSEWSALTPYFRVHNSSTNNTRTPWSYDAATLARWKDLSALHDRAVPYLRRLWREARRTGMPITRPMWLAAPEAPGARTESQQWMLGDDVLVAPVVEEGATTRRVTLPRGCWQLQDGSGRRVRGPGRVTVDAPLGRLPYFFRCGERPF